MEEWISLTPTGEVSQLGSGRPRSFLPSRSFLRDRSNADRAQIDLVGAWATASYERRSPWDIPRVVEGHIAGQIRNASQLPVRVVQVAWRIESFWNVEDTEQSQYPEGPGVWIWTVVAGTDPLVMVNNEIRVPPQDTIQLPFDVHIGHMAPERATQPDLVNGIVASVSWLLVVDNAGRRWDVRPDKGKRARRVRRFGWKPEPPMPRQW
jgi:hypothetical protein